ncbi:reverse transcriptase family protein [Rhodococcus sp. G-MC3]|uniref:reverse transcriptase family protein n=1 Tax=Rhodococcus sp. G-MC3 TaxID=3046209 RepID=UPI0024BA7136|nr:reverse transcriptase family protein [Rhodococcus sp. G-MC3]MDJ0394386.1 reverse transcriptase family protein [Rhodococcus sp. G-MC3]
MTERQYKPAMAAFLAQLAAEVPWTRDRLEEAFTPILRIKAARLADRLIDMYPAPPFDEASLYRLIADLPTLPEITETIARRIQGPKPWRFDVPRYVTTSDLAESLNLTIPEIEWFADAQSRLIVAPQPLRHYRTAAIPKRSGARLLEVPKPRLREIQRKILRRILDQVPAHRAAHGFVKGRSPRTFGIPHAGRDVVITVDLKDFFPSIGISRVVAIFDALGYPRTVAWNLAYLCTTTTPAAGLSGLPYPHTSLLRTRHLPQGAPTSPALANLVALHLDIRLSGLAVSMGMRYSRYADDLAFSGSGDADRLLWAVGQIVRDEGFSLNRRKTRVRRAHTRQEMAGLVVNDWPSVPRHEYDEVRAILHNCISTGPQQQNRRDVPDFRAHLYGRIARIGETSARRRRKLLDIAEQVDWSR